MGLKNGANLRALCRCVLCTVEFYLELCKGYQTGILTGWFSPLCHFCLALIINVNVFCCIVPIVIHFFDWYGFVMPPLLFLLFSLAASRLTSLQWSIPCIFGVIFLLFGGLHVTVYHLGVRYNGAHLNFPSWFVGIIAWRFFAMSLSTFDRWKSPLLGYKKYLNWNCFRFSVSSLKRPLSSPCQ